MVPDDCSAVRPAKKICAGCPVSAACLAEAEEITTQRGMHHAQGVWGGLTMQERATLAVLGRPPGPCPRCALVCIPVNYATKLCSTCNPKARVAYNDYRALIEEMIDAGASYQQVADRLRLTKDGVTGACLRWGKPAKAVTRRGDRAVKECGTLAAKERHRKRGVSWQDCACRYVPWKKGRPRKRSTDGGK